MSEPTSVSEDDATSPLFQFVGSPIYSKPWWNDRHDEVVANSIASSLFDHCPTCKHPYASNFHSSGSLTDQPVCNGGPGVICIPTVYMAFAYPLESMQVEVEREGRKYKGVVYLVKEEEIN